MKRNHLLIGLAISAVLIYFLVREIDGKAVLGAFRRVHFGYVAAAASLSLVILFVRAMRWQYLMDPIKPLGLGPLYSATIIGFMANGLLPVRMGELVRAYVIGEKGGVSKSASFGTIVVERIFDGFAVLLILFLLAAFMPIPPGMEEYGAKLRWVGVISFAANIAVFSLLALLVFQREWMVGAMNRVLRPLPEMWREKGIELLSSFADGLEIIRRGGRLAAVVAYSIGLWALSIVPNYIMFFAFGIDLPFHAAAFLLVAMAFGVMIPSSPGFIGTYHAAVVAGLAFFSIPQELALSYAVLIHLAAFVPIIAAGFIFLGREGLSMSQISRVDGNNERKNKASVAGKTNT